uniref:Putative vitellogenin-1 isoform X1 n=1 Tax=Davidia involucrata TaxID=16924 RepID=A0A5B6YJZ7_DAVIN
MARNCADGKWGHSNSFENEEEEEEALSLCDLPINEENDQSRKEEESQTIQTEEDFDFGSWGGSVLTKSEMCAADEVFFQGQILPLRHSISSDSGLQPGFSRNPSRCVSRSESMDHCYSGGFTSVSSRSSSIRSYHSSSSGSSTTKTKQYYKPIRVRNQFDQFHSHPSPTPQIRVSSIRHHGNVSHRCHKSTIWSFFRVGLVRTPEIELQDLKVRGNNNSTAKNFGCYIEKKKKQQSFFDKNSVLFGGCKCSVNAVETVVPSRIVLIKSNSVHVNEEKEQVALKNKTKQRQHGKQAVSRHRTFEWLKELSLVGVPDEA